MVHMGSHDLGLLMLARPQIEARKALQRAASRSAWSAAGTTKCAGEVNLAPSECNRNSPIPGVPNSSKLRNHHLTPIVLVV